MTEPLRLRERSAEALADWVEVNLTLGPTSAMSANGLQEMIRDQLGSSSASVDMALNVMERRQRLLGKDWYPFRVTAVGVQLRAATTAAPYTALLLMSQEEAPLRATATSLGNAAVVLELLTAAAAKGLFGSLAQSARFGWPSDEGRPPSFPDGVRWLSERMGVPLGSAYRPPRRQDGGVDVVVWRSFADGQPGFPVMLIQCTLERDFVHKSSDIDLRVWSGWLSFDTDPLTALAIPYTVAKDEDWREMASRTVVLDRLRLVTLLRDQGVTDTDWVQQWSETECVAWTNALAE